MASLIFSLPFLALLLPPSRADSTCFFPDGSVATNDFPCIDDTQGAASPCCGNGNVCLTNGLCFDGLGINRGSCTDKEWQSNQCIHICTQFHFTGLWPCMDSNGVVNGYSCIYGNCTDPIALQAGRLQVNTRLASSLSLNTPTATVTSAINTLTTTATVQATGSVVPTTGSSASNHSTVSTGAAAGIGAGVGIPLLITSIIGFTLFMLERRKRRQLENSTTTKQPEEQQLYDAGPAPPFMAQKTASGYPDAGYAPMPAHEVDGHHPQELEGYGKPPELMGNMDSMSGQGAR